MKEHEIIINTELCIGCGSCAADCVAGAIKIENGKAVMSAQGCIACCHCEAVCPVNAVTVTGYEEEPVEYEEQERLDPVELMNAIRTRRSIRQFSGGKVPPEVIADIIEAGRIAPTGSNSQKVSYIVIEKKLPEVEAQAVKLFRTLAGVGSLVSSYLKGVTIDDNFFFKGAPCAIVIEGGAVDGSIAAENMAFMAEAHGLGVLYSGFFTMCANRLPEIRKMLGMEKGEKAATTLVIGYPAVKYHRTVRRKKANVRFV